MDMIKRYIGDFRFSRYYFSYAKFSGRSRFPSILSTPELLVLAFMTVFGSSYLLLSGKTANFNDWKVFSSDKQFPDSYKETIGLNESFKIQNLKRKNLDMISNLKDRYSFKGATLGFSIANLDFLGRKNMDIVENELSASLPVHMRKRAKKYLRPALLLSEKHQVDPFWVISIMWTESHFVPTAKSSVGAKGLMQLMPKTKAWIYNVNKRKGNKLVVEDQMANINYFFNRTISPKELRFYKTKLVNIELGVIYLKYLLKKFDYNHKLATVAYNMGPGWTRHRLRNKLPVGQKNVYLDKVRRAYSSFSQKI